MYNLEKSLRGRLDKQYGYINHLCRSKKKWKKYLKYLKKHIKMIYSTANNTGYRKEMRKIKKIHAKTNRKSDFYSSNSSRNNHNSSLSSDSEWEIGQIYDQKEINKLDHVMNSNLKEVNRVNGIMENEPKFDSTSNLYIYLTKDQ